MNVKLTKEQYRRVIFKLLDELYGPELSYNKGTDVVSIFSNDGEEVFRVYLKGGRARGCKKDLFVLGDTTDEIGYFIPKSEFRKKLFARTIVSYVNEKTDLNIDCVEFWFPTTTRGIEHEKKYNFNVKKNKKPKKSK
jgi:hypothetical protein